MSQKTSLPRPRSLLIAVSAAVMGFALGAAGWALAEDHSASAPVTVPSVAQAAQAKKLVDLPSFTPIVDQYGNAIVKIDDSDTKIVGGENAQNPFPKNSPFYQFFQGFPGAQSPQKEKMEALGSGFIISSNGYIVTAGHVVRGMHHIIVTLTNHRAYPAKVVGLSVRYDTALLKIPAHNLPTVQLGNSNDLKVGQWLLAIGMPFGFYNTVTQGVVSALDRSLPHDDEYIPFIQSDVPINPGNSGGPIFNMEGQVVGINDQIYTNDGGYMGLSFSIPINTAMRAVHAFLEHKKLTFGWLGVDVQEVSPQMAKALHLKEPVGALIASVQPHEAAAKAGLRSGDVIVTYNHIPIYSVGQLPPLVGDTRPGKTVPVGILRNGKPETIEVKVGVMPQKMRHAEAVKTADIHRLGIRVTTLGPQESKTLGIHHGVVIESVYPGPAAEIGLTAGMAIQQIDQQEVTSPQQLAEIVKHLPSNEPIPMLVRQGQESLYVVVHLPRH
ncbi:Do family serine endopeptidase [Acidithiobacillus caldus]|uniref:Do family serine endopeptidase n=1 Tax=Acidithiobacillus caldus TaxID=33059 RepID=UPI001C06EA1B|nr:Do family serine endopeptidase [Acidithiobacillus caldus]MBU2789848.1 Do family serine endopeptidase [Acidithiobacillus caldus]MBU2819872.1 Do family serine endopeptidase [Acidithiobacillus caldus]